ncbi:signal recognition particle GTPase [Bacillus ectoiniformans]|uniref:CotO family spore coat protein n=1 Tax=Bacillus ectoiniformans TaxID=1494429 RepID=UPI00195DA30E|nr:CotO family spore coat protein [Bacillus ectoiniformans]MBM7647524.1 signal recognition particle GTPase [Bacillus ectoiniformans]
MKKKEKREPLMYIHQPVFKQEEANMQTTYHVKQAAVKQEEKPAEKQEEKRKPETLKNEEAEKKKKKIENRWVEKWNVDEEKTAVKQPLKELEPILTQADEKPAEPVSKRPSWMEVKPVKSFQEMDLEEKLQHINRQFIPFPCEFVCEGTSHKGILRKLTEQEIHIKTFKDEQMTIKRQELKNIRLIGPI